MLTDAEISEVKPVCDARPVQDHASERAKKGLESKKCISCASFPSFSPLRCLLWLSLELLDRSSALLDMRFECTS